MADSGNCRSVSQRKNPGFRLSLCCYFSRPKSPDKLPSFIKSDPNPKFASNSVPNSPSPISSSKLALGLGRMLSPGRVSPIDCETPHRPLPESNPDFAPPVPNSPLRLSESISSMEVTVSAPASATNLEWCERDVDLRLDVKGKDGKVLRLELDSEVVRSNSAVLAEKIGETRWRSGPDCRCSIEVGDVDNLEAFKETIELMHEKDVLKRLMKIGVSRSIDILEVSSDIMFDVGIKSCLKYLEAVPWCESEEERLKSLFRRCMFDEPVAQDILARLNVHDSSSQPIGLHLVQSITHGVNTNAKRELKTLVKGLLSTSAVYQNGPTGINKEDLYQICESCLNALKNCFREASSQVSEDQATTKYTKKTLIGRISEQVDNLNWLLEILIDRQIAEDFVSLWAYQSELLRMHGAASPMIRYELSRVSACVFIALGRGKLQCRGEERYAILRAWFGPMLADFGWLQRCSKGLDLRELEEPLGHALLTLTLRQQQDFFVEWFRYFSGHGKECPNLSRAFQVWWRRTFSRAEEAPL